MIKKILKAIEEFFSEDDVDAHHRDLKHATNKRSEYDDGAPFNHFDRIRGRARRPTQMYVEEGNYHRRRYHRRGPPFHEPFAYHRGRRARSSSLSRSSDEYEYMHTKDRSRHYNHPSRRSPRRETDMRRHRYQDDHRERAGKHDAESAQKAQRLEEMRRQIELLRQQQSQLGSRMHT